MALRARQTGAAKAGKNAARRSETLTEQAYRLIEEQIVTLRLKPGDVLSEQMLSATFDIGRTPIREALQRLAREGLITVLPRKGILVSDINPRSQLLVLEVRREIERLLSRAGSERATKQQRTQLLEIAQGMDRAAKTKDDLAFMRLDRELNRLMIECCTQRFCRALDEASAGTVAALLVYALPRGGRSPAVRTTACQPGARHCARQWRGGRTRQRQADGLCGNLYPRDGVMPMKTYEGRRTIDGLVVTVDGKRLDEHYDVKRLTKYGFEWTYEGESPQQLALAILYDFLENKDRAIALSEPFMKQVVANLDNDWVVTGTDVDAFLRNHPSN